MSLSAVASPVSEISRRETDAPEIEDPGRETGLGGTPFRAHSASFLNYFLKSKLIKKNNENLI